MASGLAKEFIELSQSKSFGEGKRSDTLHVLESQIETRLLKVEEKFRSHLLREQIKGFEEKVYQCYEQFSVDILYRMFLQLTKRTVVDARRVKSISMLKQCLKDLRKTLKRKRLHRNLEATPEEEKIVKYFIWFWKYLTYLKQLRDNFVERIFNPLFKYFYTVDYNQPDREDTTASIPSVLSFRSGYSESSGFSSLTSLFNEKAEFGTDEWTNNQVERRRFVTRQALATLAGEFRNIKKLYDSSEEENVAKRLLHLKERLNYLLDIEEKIDSKLLCQDSEGTVFHLKIKDRPIENLIRFVPDILSKFQKAAWLASRWLDLDDQKTKDLNLRLDKLTALENDMNRRLRSLSNDIKSKELELDVQTNTLNKLLEREERSTNLNYKLFDLERQKLSLIEQSNNLINERKELAEKLTSAAQKNDKDSYRRLRPLYNRNKLQRFALERQLNTLNYHAYLAENDMRIELEVKPSVINSTNDVQDKCEELEERIEKARKEQKVIQTALLPILEDKRYVEQQVEIKELISLAGCDSLPALKAEYVHSVPKPLNSSSPTELFDFKASSGVAKAKEKPVSLFLTSLPDDDNDTSKQQPMNLVPPRIRQKPVIEVVASEW